MAHRKHLSSKSQRLAADAQRQRGGQSSNYLLDIGNGNIPTVPTLGVFTIPLPNEVCLEYGNLSGLCDFVHRNLQGNYSNLLWLANRAIITPTNEAFIKKLTPSGFPAHILKLKKGIYIRLLGNLDLLNRHYNGTRYIIISLHNHVIEAEVALEPYAGTRLLIPRIPHIYQEFQFLFSFTSKQFPVKPAFALTYNNA
uniref:DNA helicase Pif1-like 2B domain-containing protein n=1 Tax=Octopus bimaculoides TaxID=37653 RepID=A0A0L8HCC7_OCTBM